MLQLNVINIALYLRKSKRRGRCFRMFYWDIIWKHFICFSIEWTFLTNRYMNSVVDNKTILKTQTWVILMDENLYNYYMNLVSLKLELRKYEFVML